MARTWKSLFVVPLLIGIFASLAFAQTSLDVIPTSWNPSVSANQTDISIFLTGTNPNASWSVTSNALWLTTSVNNGSGSGTVTAYVTANTDTNSRTGTITITGVGTTPTSRIVTVTQAASPVITYLGVSQTSWAAAGTQSRDTVQVTITGTYPNTAWTATSGAAWLTIAPGSGNGSGQFIATAAANTGNPRSTTIIVHATGTTPTGDTINVTQDGQITTLGISPANWSPTYTTGSTTVTLTIAGGVPTTSWSATSYATWLSITPTSGTGSHALTATVTANSTINPRTGYVVINATGTIPSADTFFVTQAGRPPVTNIAVSPTTWTTLATASQTTITVNVTGDLPGSHWTASSDQTWLTASPTSGNGTATLTASVTANGSTSNRTATLTINGTNTTPSSVSVAVTQIGQGVNSYLTVTPSSGNVAGTATTDTFSVGITGPNPNASWSIGSGSPWLTALPVSGIGTTSVIASVTANPDTAQRVGTLTVTGNATSPTSQTFTLTQAGRALLTTMALNQTTWSAPRLASSDTVNVTIAGDSPSAHWVAAVGTGNWLTVTSGTHNGSNRFLVTTTTNGGANSRSGTVIVTGTGTTPTTDTLHITQVGTNVTTMVVTPTTWSPIYTGGSTPFVLTIAGTNPFATWNVVSTTPGWLTVSPTNGAGNATLTGTATANPDTATRIGMLIITGTGTTPTADTIRVTQAGRPPVSNMGINPTTWDPTSAAGQLIFNVTISGDITNSPWAISSNSAWLTVNPLNGTGSGQFTATITANTNVNYRTGILTLTGTGTTPLTTTVTVTQAGTGPVTSLDIAPITWNPSYTAASTPVAITVSGSNPNANWSTASNAAWLTTTPTSGSGTTTISANITANPDTSVRTATLTITGAGTTPTTRTMTVTQTGRPIITNLSLNHSSWVAGAAVSHDTVIVTITGDNPTAHWAAYAPPTWISETPNNGNGSGQFIINTQANGGGTRNGYVVVTGSGTTPTTDTVYVTQAGNTTTTMSVSPTTWAPAGTAASNPFTVTMAGANPNAAWSVASGAGWITFTPNSGTGSNTFSANIVANPDTLPRSTIIVVTGTGTLPTTDTITVTQAGRAVLTNLSVNPTSWSPGANATQTSIGVVLSGDYPNSHWTVSSNQTWLTPAPTSGNGSGSFIASVTSNTDANYRSGILTIVSSATTPDTIQIQVIQSGTGPVTQMNVTPNSFDAPYTSGSSNVSVTILGTNPNASWTTSANVGWLSATPSSSTGGQNVAVNYAANTDTATRVGTLTFTGTGTTPTTRTVTVTQTGRPPISTLEITPASIVQSANGQTDSILVTIGGDILTAAWHVTSSANWLSANPTGRSGTGTFAATSTGNFGANPRNGYLVVTGTGTVPVTDTLFVTQAGRTSTTLTVSPTTINQVYSASQTPVTVTIAGANPNSAWTVASDAGWLTTSTAGGTGSGSFNAIFTANADTISRSATLIVTGTGTTPTADTIIVTQAGRPVSTTLVVNPNVWNPTSVAGQTSFGVTITGDHLGAHWTVQSNAAWLTPAPTNGNGNGSFIASVTANTDTTYRTGVLSIHANTATPDTIRITVVQAGTGPVTQLNVTPTSANVPNTAGQSQIGITITGSNLSASTTVTSNATWLTANPATGNGTRNFDGIYTANPDTSSRLGTLTITGVGTTPLTRTVVFTQAGRPPLTNMTVSTQSLVVGANGQTDSVLVTISGDNPSATWHAVSNATTWLTVNPSTRNGSNTFAIISALNFGNNSRNGYVVVTGTGTTPLTDTIFVTQAGRNTTTMTVSPATINAPNVAGQTPVNITIAGANPTAAWTAVSGATWLTLSVGSGAGSGSFNAIYAANTDTLPRSANIIIIGTGTTPATDTVHVNQAARPVVTNLAVVPSTWNPTASAGQTSFLITLTGDHPNTGWTVTSSTQWLSALPTSGTGGGSFIAQVTANPDTAYRAGILIVHGTGTTPDSFQIAVTQAGQSPSTLLTVSPTSYNYLYAGGNTNVTITVSGYNPNAAWTVNSTAGWLTTNPISGNGNRTLVATATANPDTSSRSATLTITGTGTTPLTRSVTITQNGRPPVTNMSVSQAFWDAAANGAVDTVRVLVSGDVPNAHWSLTSTVTWLTLNPNNGNGTGAFQIVAQFNTNNTPRTGVVVVHGTDTTPLTDSIFVTQAGRAVTNMTVTPTSMNVAQTAGTDTFALSVTGGNTGAAWTTTSNSAWIIVTPAAGNGSSSVVAHVLVNTDTTARTGTFFINGNGTTPTTDTVTIHQAGRPPVTNLAVNPTTWNPTSAATDTTVNVVITGDVTNAHWTASSNQTWLTVNPNNGNGSGIFTASVVANPDTGFRSATITVTGTGTTPLTATILVTQTGTGPITSMTVSPVSWNPSGAVNSRGLSVTITGTNTNAAWSVTSNQTWLSATPTSGNGSGNVTASVLANPDTSARIGALTFTGTGTQPNTRTVFVTQAGRAVVTQLTLSTHSWNASSASSHDTISVTISGDVPSAHWTLISEAPAWLSVAPGSGNGSGTFIATTAANFAQTSRTTNLIVVGTGTTPLRDTIIVTQSGRAVTTMTTIPAIWNAASSAANDTVRITIAGGNPTAPWTVSSNMTWLSFAPGTGNGTGYFVATMTANPDTTTRSGYLIVSGTGTTPTNDTVQVTQTGRAPLTNLSVAPTIWNAASGAVNTQIALTIAGDHLTAPWTASSNQTWLTVAPLSGNGSGNITLTTTANLDTNARSAIVTITGTGTTPSTRTVSVTQAGRGLVTTLNVSPLTWSPPSTATATNVTVTIAGDVPNSSWSLVSSAVWLTVNPTSGNGSGNFTATVTANPDTAVRTATITVNGNSTTPASQVVSVTQSGRAPVTTLSLAPTTWIAPNTAGNTSVTVTISGDNPTTHWVASTPATWVTLTPSSGNGSGNFSASITANPDTSARIAVVTVAGTGTTPATTTFTITQSGRTPVTTLAVSPTSWSPGGNPDSIHVTVTIAGDNPNLHWTVASDQPWLTVSATSGNGNGQFTARVAQNNTGFGLTSHLIISAPGATPGADTITVNQTSLAVWTQFSSLPDAYSLTKIYPNPFNPSTTIEVALPQAATLVVTVYNIRGQQVAVLYNNIASAGYHFVRFDARNLPSGTYFIRAMVAGKMNQMRRIELIK